MLNLIQHSVDMEAIVAAFEKIEDIELSINMEIIDKDIERLKEEAKVTKNEINRKNAEALVKYLEKLKRNVKQGKLEITWINDYQGKRFAYTYPVEFINEPLYGINTCNYIELDTAYKLVEIDISEIGDLIAFEYLHRDLGEDHSSIESLLESCGILGYEKSSFLMNYFAENGDKPYELSKTLKVDECIYLIPETREIKDYFNTTKFKGDSYRRVVEYSAMYASMIIAHDIQKRISHKNVDAKPLLITPTTMSFMVNSEKVNIDSDLLTDITVRIFGRQFKISPKVTII